MDQDQNTQWAVPGWGSTPTPRRTVTPLTYPVVSGNVWTGPTITFKNADFDFLGCTVLCQLRRQVDGPVIHTFTLTLDTSVVGKAVFTLEMTGVETADICEGLLYGDVLLSRVSPAYGPYSLSPFQISVTTPISRV